MPTLQDGREAIEQGNLQQARLIFEAILQENHRSEEAWLGLAEVISEPDDKRICYENALKINKNSRAAKEGLRNLEPQEDPLVAALGRTSAPVEDTEPPLEDPLLDDEETVVSSRQEPPIPVPTRQSDTPVPILVAVGLALSVIVFAIGGGIIYFVLSTLATP